MKHLSRIVYIVFCSITLILVLTMDIQETTLKALVQVLVLFVVVSFMNIYIELIRQTDKDTDT